MALVVKDRVKVTTTTTGTGTLTLGAASTGYQAFSVIGDGNTTYYTVVDAATGAWEVGLGTYTASGTTLSRDTVLESSNTGSLVDFGAGSKDVFVAYPAEVAVFTSAAQTLTNKSFTGSTGLGTDWTVAQSGSSLIFSYQGTAKLSLSSAGALTAVDNITAYGTI